MRQGATKIASSLRFWILLGFVWMAVAVPAGAQKKNKKDAPPPDIGEELQSQMHTPDSQAIDMTISEALGYWQIGDTDSMRKYYSDDIVTVSGAYEPPIVGWDNFLKAYKLQRAQITGERMDRSNTLIKVLGNSAWATYQFVYVVQTQDRVSQFRGHTTLFLAKQANRWVITMNHSSVVDSALPQAASPMDSSQTGKP